ncbi:MAG: protein kinase [Terracidiphilus sp.]|jgi:tetratricopeptide (TPR) repeat protein/predicted Ser/Thr protein kinase
MDDPKKQKYEPEAPTIVVDKSVSVPPISSENQTTVKGPVPPAMAPIASSEAPTIIESDRPTLAATTNPEAFPSGVTMPPGAQVRLAGAATVAGSGALKDTSLQAGTVFANRYEIIKTLGEGGMGAVYKARDLELEREVALKVIKPELSNNPEILQRFKQELILARQVTDRNIIRIFDLGEADGIKFITMENVDGQNLHQLLKERGKLEVAEAVDIMEQVAAGLSAAHREGIIHRDLKPGNIMRDVSGRVVVMDFGLARTISGDGMTRTGAMLGTIEYMSPEQAQGKDLKASSDVFTFGLILYELVTGFTPFRAESAIASLLMRSQQRAIPLSDVDKNIPGTLSNIVAKCLEKEPQNRYQSAAELDADLRAWQGSGGRKVSASSMRLRMNRLRELPWPRIAITGVLALAIASGIAWFVIRRQLAAKSGQHVPVTVLVGDFANNTGDPVFDNTLEPMLGAALEGASFINVFSRGDARKLAEKLPHPSDKLDEQSARLIAENEGVNAVVTGDISLRGDSYDISAIALDAVSGKELAKAEISVANKQDILRDLPKLAAPIRKALGDTTPPSVQFQEVSGGFKAASLEAVHEVAIGADEQFAGKFQEAFDSFQKAAQLDPNFTWAYTGMAAMDQNLGRSEDAVTYMKLAMEHVDNMTEREAYRDRGLYYLTTGDWQDCVQEYTQLVTRFPADRVGQNNLATCYTQLRNAPKALEAAKQAVEIVPKGVGPRLNLAFISSFAGDFAASEKEAQTALAINPNAALGYLVMAEAELGQDQINQSANSYHQLEGFGPAATSTATAGLADLSAYQAKYAEAADILSQGATADVVAKNSGSAARKYVALAYIEEIQGKQAAALSDVDKALAKSQSTPIEFLAARIYVEAGEYAKAHKLAMSLSSALASESQAYGKIVEGMIALKRKDTNEAIRQIRGANNLLDTWIGHYDLGRVYLEAGAFTEADSEFDQCMKRRGEAIELFDDNVPTYAYLPPVYYYQGRAREGMKSEGFADFYKTYLSIRGQSTEDPMVAEIRSRQGQ